MALGPGKYLKDSGKKDDQKRRKKWILDSDRYQTIEVRLVDPPVL
jgi:hypothetical protein